MATLSISNTFELVAQGRTIAGKHGEAADAASVELEITVDGVIHDIIGSLATATVVTVWDDDNDVPADFSYLFFWADVDMYIQIVGSATNVIFKVEAFQPFVLPGFDTMLAAADTTIITGGSEPSLTDIDSIVIGNYSGGTGNYHFAVIG